MSAFEFEMFYEEELNCWIWEAVFFKSLENSEKCIVLKKEMILSLKMQDAALNYNVLCIMYYVFMKPNLTRHMQRFSMLLGFKLELSGLNLRSM